MPYLFTTRFKQGDWLQRECMIYEHKVEINPSKEPNWTAIENQNSKVRVRNPKRMHNERMKGLVNAVHMRIARFEC